MSAPVPVQQTEDEDKVMAPLVPAKMFREFMAGAVAGPLNQEFTSRAVLKFIADGGDPDTTMPSASSSLR